MTRPRPKGSKFEREVARRLGPGARRTPLSGSAGGNDITLDPDHVMADWGLELKRRKTLPVSVMSWLAQAEYALPVGSGRRPAVVMRQDHARAIFCCYFEDLLTWAQALSEMGGGARVRALSRQLRSIATELEKTK